MNKEELDRQLDKLLKLVDEMKRLSEAHHQLALDLLLSGRGDKEKHEPEGV